MSILTKYKKKGQEGFKKLVTNLETNAPKKQKEIFLECMLEDPVYSSWIPKNLIRIDSFMALNEDEIVNVYERLGNKIPMLIYSFAKTPYEDTLLNEKLPSGLKKQYLEEVNYIGNKVTETQRDASRISIFRTMRQLVEFGDISNFHWDLPGLRIMEGSYYQWPRTGKVELNYESGGPAVRGEMIEGEREGEWFFSHPNGEILAIGHYSKGLKTKEWVFRYPNGKVQSQGIFKKNQKHGEWNEFNIEGVETVTLFEDGEII